MSELLSSVDPGELIAEDLNRFLRGWAAYFRFGNSADRFGKIRNYALMRMALFIAKRARRSREFGWAVLACRSPDQLRLITLSGIVVASRGPATIRNGHSVNLFIGRLTLRVRRAALGGLNGSVRYPACGAGRLNL